MKLEQRMSRLVDRKFGKSMTSLPEGPPWAMARFYLDAYQGPKSSFHCATSDFLYVPERKLVVWYSNSTDLSSQELRKFVDAVRPVPTAYFTIPSIADRPSNLQGLGAMMKNSMLVKTYCPGVSGLRLLHRDLPAEYRMTDVGEPLTTAVEIFFQDEKVSACKIVWQGTHYAEIGGWTHEKHRRRGLFAAAVSRLSSILIGKSIAPLYMFEEDNFASQRTAETLGFEDSGGREATFFLNIEYS